MSDSKKPPVIGSKIKLSHAKQLISDYKTNSGDGHIHSFTISADHIRKIIDQPDCHYVKVHVGLSAPSTKNVGLSLGHTLVFTGADSTAKTIVNGEEDTEAYDDVKSCPPTCPHTDEI